MIPSRSIREPPTFWTMLVIGATVDDDLEPRLRGRRQGPREQDAQSDEEGRQESDETHEEPPRDKLTCPKIRAELCAPAAREEIGPPGGTVPRICCFSQIVASAISKQQGHRRRPAGSATQSPGSVFRRALAGEDVSVGDARRKHALSQRPGPSLAPFFDPGIGQTAHVAGAIGHVTDQAFEDGLAAWAVGGRERPDGRRVAEDVQAGRSHGMGDPPARRRAAVGRIGV